MNTFPKNIVFIKQVTIFLFKLAALFAAGSKATGVGTAASLAIQTRQKMQFPLDSILLGINNLFLPCTNRRFVRQ